MNSLKLVKAVFRLSCFFVVASFCFCCETLYLFFSIFFYDFITAGTVVARGGTGPRRLPMENSVKEKLGTVSFFGASASLHWRFCGASKSRDIGSAECGRPRRTARLVRPLWKKTFWSRRPVTSRRDVMTSSVACNAQRTIQANRWRWQPMNGKETQKKTTRIEETATKWKATQKKRKEKARGRSEK